MSLKVNFNIKIVAKLILSDLYIGLLKKFLLKENLCESDTKQNICLLYICLFILKIFFIWPNY